MNVYLYGINFMDFVTAEVIHITAGALFMSNCAFTNTQYAIYAGANSVVSLSNTNFYNNPGRSSNPLIQMGSCDFSFDNCTFDGNRGGYDLEIMNTGCTTVEIGEIRNSVFSNSLVSTNSLWVINFAAVNISSTKFHGNIVPSIDSSGQMILDGAEFFNNTAPGIVLHGASAQIRGTSFHNNSKYYAT